MSFPATCSGKFPFKSSGSSLNCSGNPPDLMLNCRLDFFSTHSCRLGNSICYPREEIQLAFMVTRGPINLPQKTKSWLNRSVADSIFSVSLASSRFSFRTSMNKGSFHCKLRRHFLNNQKCFYGKEKISVFCFWV